MRIISNFSDYYDGVMAGDKGPPIYQRCTQEVTSTVDRSCLSPLLKVFESMPSPGFVYNGVPNFASNQHLTGHRSLVLFCGRLYAYWRRRPCGAGARDEAWTASKPDEVFLNANGLLHTVLAEIEAIGDRRSLLSSAQAAHGELQQRGKLHRQIRALLTQAKPDRYTSWDGRSERSFCDVNIAAWEDEIPDLDWGALHRHVASPIIALASTARSISIHIDPCLKDLGFAVLVDPWQAAQEIDMYLGGVLVDQQDGTSSISDEDMAAMKGFNDRSFKNVAPGARKARRKLNKDQKKKRDNSNAN